MISAKPFRRKELADLIDAGEVCNAQAADRALSANSAGVLKENTVSVAENFSDTDWKWTAKRAKFHLQQAKIAPRRSSWKAHLAVTSRSPRAHISVAPSSADSVSSQRGAIVRHIAQQPP